jgi:hypothetical protein
MNLFHITLVCGEKGKGGDDIRLSPSLAGMGLRCNLLIHLLVTWDSALPYPLT